SAQAEGEPVLVIAYCKETGSVGIGVKPSIHAAVRDAVTRCSGFAGNLTCCDVALRVWGARCGALSEGRICYSGGLPGDCERFVGYGLGETMEDAKNSAEDMCEGQSSVKCRPVATRCRY